MTTPDPVPGQLPLVPGAGDLTDQERQLVAELERLRNLRDAGIVAALEFVRGHRDKLREHRAQLDKAVADARRRGATWQQIGDAAGLTRHAAWERWNRA